MIEKLHDVYKATSSVYYGGRLYNIGDLLHVVAGDDGPGNKFELVSKANTKVEKPKAVAKAESGISENEKPKKGKDS